MTGIDDAPGPDAEGTRGSNAEAMPRSDAELVQGLDAGTTQGEAPATWGGALAAGVTREDVMLAFDMLLGRAPESEATIEQHRRLPDRRTLAGTILRSAEGQTIHAPAGTPAEAAPATAPQPAAGDGSTLLALWRFARDGEAGPAMREGWAAPDLDACWTIGATSRLELPLPETLPDADLALVIALAAFHRPQQLSVSVGGRELAVCVVRGATALAVRVPRALCHGRPWLDLALGHPDAVRPCDVSPSHDDRRLAFSVQWVELATLPQAPPSPPVGDLLQHFQNLGESCEFGLLLQRHAEGGSGLLRFSFLPYDQLLRGILGRFAGFPDRARLRLERHATRTGGTEAMVREDGHGFLTHTGVADTALRDLDEATLLDREAVRLGWLRRLFVEELEDGQTIFVYRTRPARSHAEATALWLALRRHGGCTLLWVVEEEPGLPAGSVLVLGEGFLKGFIERLAPADNAEDLHAEGWLALCRRALALARADGRGSSGR